MTLENKFESLNLYCTDGTVPPGQSIEIPMLEITQPFTVTIGKKNNSGWTPWETSNLNNPYIQVSFSSETAYIDETVNNAVCRLSRPGPRDKRLITFNENQLDSFQITLTIKRRPASNNQIEPFIGPEVGSTVTIGEEPPGLLL